MKKFVLSALAIAFVFACQKKLEPKEVLMNWYYGCKEMDVDKVKSAVIDYPGDFVENNIPFAAGFCKGDIVWLRDSTVSADTVLVYYASKSNPNNTYFRTVFKYKGRWATKF